MSKELKKYNVTGRIRLGPGDIIWLDDPEQIDALIKLGVIEPIKAERPKRADTKEA